MLFFVSAEKAYCQELGQINISIDISKLGAPMSSYSVITSNGDTLEFSKSLSLPRKNSRLIIFVKNFNKDIVMGSIVGDSERNVSINSQSTAIMLCRFLAYRGNSQNDKILNGAIQSSSSFPALVRAVDHDLETDVAPMNDMETVKEINETLSSISYK